MRTVHKKHRDLQRAVPVAKCALCGGEIYPGESFWRIWGRGVLCRDCVYPWLDIYPVQLGEVRL